MKGKGKGKGSRTTGNGIYSYVASLSDEDYELIFFGGKGRGYKE